MAKQSNIIVEQAQLSADPSSPASGFTTIYPKTDGFIYVKLPAGTVYKLADQIDITAAKARTNHSGTQLAATISDFNAAALAAAPAETTTTEGALINSATGKTTPVDADHVGLMDSAASNILKKLSWANIKATLKTYFDSLTTTLTNKTLTSPVINTPTGIVKGDVGLGSVDNTSDAGKPVSTAQQTALDLKSNLASPTFTGTPAAPTASLATNTTQLATTAFVIANAGIPADDSVTNAKLANVATATIKGRNTAATGDPEDLSVSTVKTMLSLNNVDNTSNTTERAATATLTNKTLTSPIINVGSDATGDIYYRNSGGTFTRLAAGTNGKVLKMVAGIPAWGYQQEVYMLSLSDLTTDLATNTFAGFFRIPYACTLDAVRIWAKTAPTGQTIIVDITESGTTIFSTKVSIDISEKTSTTAASAAVISDASLADDAELIFKIDQPGSTVKGNGLMAAIYITRT